MQNDNFSKRTTTPFMNCFTKSEDGTWILNSPVLIFSDGINVHIRDIANVEVIKHEECSELKITTVSGTVISSRQPGIPDTQLETYVAAILDAIHDESKPASQERNTSGETPSSDVHNTIESALEETTALAADASQTPHQNDVSTTATDAPQEDPSRVQNIKADNPQNDYKPNPLRCFFNMYRYAFTMKARTGRREFFIAAGIHFFLLLALSIFTIIIFNTDPSCHGGGEWGGMECLFFYFLLLPILTFIIQYIPFNNMIIRRCLDGDKCNSEDDYKTSRFCYRLIYYIIPLILSILFIISMIYTIDPYYSTDGETYHLRNDTTYQVMKSVMIVMVITTIVYACFTAIFSITKIFKPSSQDNLLKRI